MPANIETEAVPDDVLDAALAAWVQSEARHMIPVRGNSMLPSLQDGDRLEVVHGTAGLRRGDIVVFRAGGRLMAHRILRCERGAAGLRLLTQGDNASRPDAPVTENAIVGRAQAVERDGRRQCLDARAWRWLGWFMAVGTLAGNEPMRKVLRRLLRRLW